jgi:hypothetical protein
MHKGTTDRLVPTTPSDETSQLEQDRLAIWWQFATGPLSAEAATARLFALGLARTIRGVGLRT